MKKLFAILAVLVVSAALAQSTADLLTRVTTTGAGAAISLPRAVDKTYQASGSTSAGTGTAVITVQCSNNGASWNTLGTTTLTLGTVTTSLGFSSQDRCAQVRGNVTSISGTSTVNLSVGY